MTLYVIYSKHYMFNLKFLYLYVLRYFTTFSWENTYRFVTVPSFRYLF